MITASIVLYNTKQEELDKVIASYKPSADRLLFLVDNSQVAFTQKSMEKYCSSFVYYFFNNANLGYGSAHNIALKKAIEMKSDYHVIMNSDITFESEVIEELIVYANAHRDVVYLLPKVLYPDGTIQYLCKLLPTPVDLFFRRFAPPTTLVNKRNDKYLLKKSGYNRIINPPCLSGCFMFLRTEMIAENNLFFDERYFLYCEDFDLMRRMHRIGKTLFYPHVTIVHNYAQDSYKDKKMMFQHMKSAVKYFNKFGWFIDLERHRMNRQILMEIENYECLENENA